MERVIINGDDLGMNRRCSAAILQALELGLITHTSAMANGEYFSQAVSLAESKGFLDRIGIHFNLTEGFPLTKDICSIPDFVVDGRFHKGYFNSPRVLTQSEQEAVIAELEAQARRLEASGIDLSHADSHHYVHNYAQLAPLFAAVCLRHRIGRIRINRTFDTPERPRITKDRIDDSFWREQGFDTTLHFGRISDIDGISVPDDTEIMAHPDLDRNGDLIDRERMKDGYPTGRLLTGIIK